MPEPLRKLSALFIATFVAWFSVAMIGLFNSPEFVRGAAVILAFISTITIWTLWALNEYGIGTEAIPAEKAKRATGSDEDPRLAVLLSLFTPEERDTLRARLADSMEAEGETVSLADLLSESEQQRTGARN